MSYNPQLAICGSTPTSGPIALCLPSIEQVTLSNLDTLKNHVDKYSESRSFILLFLDSIDPNSSPDLEDLRKKAHVFAIFICVKPGCHLTFNGGNVFPVAKQFITQKIASSLIRFFQTASEIFLASNNIFQAAQFKRRANAIKDQRRSTNTTIHACHVLIIPMNVTEDDLYEFQERLINLCNDLCGEYEPTVCTLDNYFSSDENSDIYGHEGVTIKCNFIKTISRIRMYLIGNEMYNLHSLSQSVLDSESNDLAQDHYDKKHTFVEYQPVTEQTKMRLANLLGSTWRSTDTIPKRLDAIRDDIEFPAALERANRSRELRTIAAISELNQEATNNADSSIEVSGAFHTIDQVQNGAYRGIDDLIRK